MTNLNVESTPPPSWWSNKPFGFFTETLPRVYNQVVGRLNENQPVNQAMQRAQFYGTAGAVGGPASDVLRGRAVNPAPAASSVIAKSFMSPAATDGEEARLLRYAQSQVAQPEADLSFEEALAGYGFDDTPYRNYMNFLLSQDEETMARINSMYRQLAKDAEENMARVGRVYEGAEKGVGEAYGSAEGVVGESYASAQQQAADQLARLGIEEAAPQVINPMALSQAEAMSNLATGKGAALGATEQFGATAQDFATQMNQVGQQQGLEVSNQILRDIARRQAEAAFQMEQARAQYNPYQQLLQEMEARQAYEQYINPQPDLGALQDQADFLYQQEQDDANQFRQYYFQYLDLLGNREEAQRAVFQDAANGLLSPRLQQWITSNPELAQQLTQ